MRRFVQALAAALALGAATAAGAHEVRPGFVELTQTSPESYSFLWKRPSGGEVELQIAPVLPPQCRLVVPGAQQLSPGAVVVRGQLSCPGGIAGKTLTIAGLESTITDVLVRVNHADGRTESHLLRPSKPAITLDGVSDAADRALGYTQLGFQHIVFGFDHLVFVLGLMLIVTGRWMLVKTITAFTVAHSITLALATLGHVSPPVPPLEAAIALSILFLGLEIVRSWRGQTSFTLRHPWIVAFAFGLLHGFGFASGLAAVGLPQGEIALALLLFNVGVELGQLGFVLVLLVLARAVEGMALRWPPAVQRLPGYLVGTLGAFWTIQRTLVMLGVTEALR